MKKNNKIKPDITFIVPTYNNINTLKKTIESISNQINLNYEIIIVDDFSDKPIKFLLNFNDKNLKIFRNNSNSGPSFSRNFGLDHARGEFICFLDSDDILSIDFGTKMLSEAKARKSPILCLSNGIKDTNSSYFPIIINYVRNIFLRFLYVFNNKQISIEHFFTASPSRMIFPKKIAKTFQFNESMRQCEDWEMVLRILKKYKIFIYPRELVSFRFSNNSQTNIQRKINGVKCYTDMINMIPMKNRSNPAIYAFRIYIKVLEQIYA